jgi:hypothetical protein
MWDFRKRGTARFKSWHDPCVRWKSFHIGNDFVIVGGAVVGRIFGTRNEVKI